MKKRFNNSEYVDADGMDFHNLDDGAPYGPVTDPRKGPLPGLGGAGYTPPAPSSAPKKNAGEQIKKGLDIAKEGVDVINSIKGLFGSKPRKTNAPNPTSPKGGSQKKGMSTGTKVAIGGGIAVLLGIIIYAATRSSKK
jgi:hypothetical protein